MSKVIHHDADCFFCSTCIPEWRELAELKRKVMSFKKGERLFAAGDSVQGLFFTLSGAVKVHKQWGDQKELIIRFATGRDIIGFRGLGGRQVFPVTATAMELTTVCFIPNSFLEASLKANPALSYRLMQFYAAELQKAEQRMSDLVHMDVKGRIARAILDMEATFRNREDGFINITISRQDIASYAGTIYETVFKVFTEWIKAGLIITEGKHIKIMNRKKLSAFVG